MRRAARRLSNGASGRGKMTPPPTDFRGVGRISMDKTPDPLEFPYVVIKCIVVRVTFSFPRGKTLLGRIEGNGAVTHGACDTEMRVGREVKYGG
jgi:hypothetical protein